jgi:uncharacterized protein (DUF697 family)
MAVCVCNADGTSSDSEKQFLQDLRGVLHLDASTADHIETQIEQLAQVPPTALPPVIPPAVAAPNNIDQTILNCAILTGALELMPHSIATMAIIPVQIRMVYQIGLQYGCELSRRHIQDFLATVGIGLTAQVVEGFARRVAANLTRTIGGRFLGGMAGVAAGSAVAFGTTYALGQVAKQYYASGRTLSAAQLKQVFSSLLSEGNSLQQRYSNQIVERSHQISASDLLPLVKRG